MLMLNYDLKNLFLSCWIRLIFGSSKKKWSFSRILSIQILLWVLVWVILIAWRRI